MGLVSMLSNQYLPLIASSLPTESVLHISSTHIEVWNGPCLYLSPSISLSGILYLCLFVPLKVFLLPIAPQLSLHYLSIWSCFSMYPVLCLPSRPGSIVGSLVSHYGPFDKAYCAAQSREQHWAPECTETLFLVTWDSGRKQKGFLWMPWRGNNFILLCRTHWEGGAFVLILKFSESSL